MQSTQPFCSAASVCYRVCVGGGSSQKQPHEKDWRVVLKQWIALDQLDPNEDRFGSLPPLVSTEMFRI